MHFGVVGHVEWVEFADVDHVPVPGEIVHGGSSFEEPAGGGAVAAATLARLGGEASLYTALGSDALAARSDQRLAELGVHVHAAIRRAPTRRALTLLDAQGERTITTLGARLEPRGDDALPWEQLADMDAVFVTAGDVAALQAARSAKVLVASPRAALELTQAKIAVDAVVLSGRDQLERERATLLQSRWLVVTAGAEGGSYKGSDGESGAWEPAALTAPIADAYGCGDTFAAALTYALGAGQTIGDATRTAAVSAARCLSRRGPF